MLQQTNFTKLEPTTKSKNHISRLKHTLYLDRLKYIYSFIYICSLFVFDILNRPPQHSDPRVSMKQAKEEEKKEFIRNTSNHHILHRLCIWHPHRLKKKKKKKEEYPDIRLAKRHYRKLGFFELNASISPPENTEI